MGFRDWWHSLTVNTITNVIILVAVSAIPPLAVWRAYGFSFVRTTHAIPGWALLGASGMGCLLLFSIGLNIKHWLTRRSATRSTLTIVAEGLPNALSWGMGEQVAPVKAPLMMPFGRFLITNTSSSNISVPRTVADGEVYALGFCFLATVYGWLFFRERHPRPPSGSGDPPLDC